MSSTPSNTPPLDEGRTLRLAKLFDLRTFIGALFLVFGVVVTIEGFIASAASIAKADGVNLSLWTGLSMLVVGLVFIGWMLVQPPELPKTGTIMEEPERARGGH